MSKPITAAALIIGNEILSGRIQDKNGPHLATVLGDVGIHLLEIRIIPDTTEAIVNAVRSMKKQFTYLFLTGGLGPTHDDITAQAVADAFECNLILDPQAHQTLKDHYGESELTPHHLKMAQLPQGASLIVNPVSKAPGFYLENVFVFAGVPRIIEAMLENILPLLETSERFETRSVSALISESAIADALSTLQEHYPHVTIGSYPFFKKGQVGTTLVARSQDQKKLEQCYQELCQLLTQKES